MKYFTTIHIQLLLVLTLACTGAAAQPDYLITTRGDTVHGELKLLFYGVEKKVQVKGDQGKQVFPILQTKEFRYENELYHPVKGPQGYTFMKLVKPGYLSLYAFSADNRTAYSSEFLVKADGSSLEVPNLGFKKQMTNFLSDCEGVSTRIEQGEMSKKDLYQIIDEYNRCIETKTVRLEQSIARRIDRSEKTNVWDALEEKIKEHDDFDGKTTALEMVSDIKKRVQRNENVPNFIIEGLKSTLASQTQLKDDLDRAIASIN